MTKSLAPVVLFAYDRPEKLRLTFKSLSNNRLADQTELIVFSDHWKSEKERENVLAVRGFLKTIRGFKSICVVERDSNLGLAKSIVIGVTEIINIHGKVIVLEDDIITNTYFLEFMNDALQNFDEEKQIMHICGWGYPILKKNSNDECFLWRGMNCWAWATWKDRWDYFDRNSELIIGSFTRKQITKLNLGGTVNFWSQLLKNNSGEIDTWAIYWYCAIMKQNGLCLNATKSLAWNDGANTGSNFVGETIRQNNIYDSSQIRNFPTVISESKYHLRQIQVYYIRIRIRNTLKRFFNLFARRGRG